MAGTRAGGLRIGALAEAAGVGVETLRFYEREGLLPDPPRTGSGYRRYPPDAVRRVRFIRKGRALGFTLAEIRDLLELRVTAAEPCHEVAARARRRLAAVEARLRELNRVRDALEALSRACEANRETGECPILDALDDALDDTLDDTLEHLEAT
ncbi:MAG: MerR family DNA-binding protein [Longimicrobiales bacterium]|nr:MerR family DNA-binding protein [Longimicrobiales bacterium]